MYQSRSIDHYTPSVNHNVYCVYLSSSGSSTLNLEILAIKYTEILKVNESKMQKDVREEERTEGSTQGRKESENEGREKRRKKQRG